MSYRCHNITYYYKYTVYKYVMCSFLKQSLYEKVLKEDIISKVIGKVNQVVF